MYKNIPEVMTLRECCEILRIGKNTMLELLHTRQIEGFRIGNRWRIPKESVVEFIERRQNNKTHGIAAETISAIAMSFIILN